MRVLTSMACVLGALLAGCTATLPSEPRELVHTTTTPAPTGLMSRKEAGAHYLQIVEPINQAQDRCVEASSPIFEGSWIPSGEEAMLARIREACQDTVDANLKFIEELQAARWPAEAQSAIDDLLVLTYALQLPFTRFAEAQTVDDAYKADETFPEVGEEANLVRARLGLPEVGEK